MPENRNDVMLDFARAVHARLPAERLAPHEHEDFDKNAELWLARAADSTPAHGGGYGLGLQDIIPEATALAMITAQNVLGSVTLAGLGRVWRSLDRRRRRRGQRSAAPGLPAGLSDAELEKVRARIIARLVELGVPEQTAALFADGAVAELSQGKREPGR